MAPVKKKNGGGKSQHQVRLDRSMIDRIGKYQQKIKHEKSVEISTSLAMRSLIDKGLQSEGL